MKKIVGSLLMSTAIIGFGIKANAAAAGVEEVGNKQIESEATIKINPGQEKPTDPEEDNVPPGDTGQNGPLSIDNVIVFNFEDMSLSGIKQHVFLKNDGTDSVAKRNVQVTDTRGTGAGWTLQVKQSDLTDSSKTKTLKGAYIEFSKGTVVAGKYNVATELPTSFAANTELNITDKSKFNTLMRAEKGQGLGTYLLKYNQDGAKDDIQLVVPSGNMIGTYQGTVTWALSDSPISEEA